MSDTINALKTFYMIDEDAQSVARAVWAVISPEIHDISEKLFETLSSTTLLAAYMRENTIETLRASYEDHWETIFNSPLDEDYEAKTMAFSLDKLKHNLRPELHVAIHDMTKNLMMDIMKHKFKLNKKKRRLYVQTIDKFLTLDLALSLTSGQQYTQELLDMQRKNFAIILQKNVEAFLNKLSDSTNALLQFSQKTNMSIMTISTQSKSVSTHSNDVFENITSISQAAQQLSYAVDEIAQQIHKTVAVTNKGKEESQRAEETVSTLSQAVGRIDEVVVIISEIANQTNLLALNATIESARSGAAGKGFAVVASEVKKLATQTTNATEEIKEKIKEIQKHTGNVVGAIQTVNHTINDINKTTFVISSAVEEQSRTTQNISRTMSDVGESAKIVKDTVSAIIKSTENSDLMASDVLSTGQQVSINAQGLNNALNLFIQRRIKIDT